MNILYSVKGILKKLHLWNFLWDLKESFQSKEKTEAFQAEAIRLRDICAKLPSYEAMIDEVFQSKIFISHQNKSEILALMNLIHERKPKIVCEIGTADGGTLFLFSRAADLQTRFLSIDLKYPTQAHSRNYPVFMQKGQWLTLIESNSCSPQTLQQVEQWLQGERIDFLFIDGDHSYDGVSQDYERYLPFLSDNGVVAFHDIHPDYRTRYGKKTFAYAGQVPFFWQELKKKSCTALEFIEDDAQDGKGIGVLLFEKQPTAAQSTKIPLQ